MDSEVFLLKAGSLNVFGLEEVNSNSELNDISGGSCYCFATAGG